MDFTFFDHDEPKFFFTTGNVDNDFYHVAAMTSFGWQRAEDWARETFGHPSALWDHVPRKQRRWYIVRRHYTVEFWFRDECDFAWFKMRWS